MDRKSLNSNRVQIAHDFVGAMLRSCKDQPAREFVFLHDIEQRRGFAACFDVQHALIDLQLFCCNDFSAYGVAQ